MAFDFLADCIYRAGVNSASKLERRPIKTSELQYDLPAELIAQSPCDPRDASRLMVIHRRSGKIEHRIFRDLPEYLRPADLLILNRTRVLPAKFMARRESGGRINGLFVHEASPGEWDVMIAGLRRLRDGESIRLIRMSSGAPADWTMTLQERLDRGLCRVRIDPPESATAILDAVGAMPLPPYIRRNESDSPDTASRDRMRYQTVFAERAGAVAAPTAGLHFTPELIDQIRSGGAATADVVLHVGLGTFQPVEVEDLNDHPMHSEWYEMPQDTANAIRERRGKGGRVVVVGTTAVRVLETCASNSPGYGGRGWTNLLIQPGYEFQSTDVLLTNFHLPGSTLLALVGAFAGMEMIRRAYGEAIEERYRFFSYGDAMLIV